MWGSRIPPPPGRQISAPISDPSPPFLQPTYLPLSSRYPRERRLSQPAPMAPRNDSGHVSPSSEEAGAPPWASRPVSMNEAPPSSPNTSLSPPLPRNRVPLAATPSYREPRGYRSRGGLSSGSDSEKETDSRFSTAPRQIRRPPPYAQLPGWSTQPPPLQRRRNDRDPYSESDSDSTAIVSGPLRQTTRTSSHTSAWPPQSSQITPAPSTFPRPAQSPPTYPPPSSRPAPPRNASRQYPSATHSASRSALRPRSRVTQPGDSSDSDSSIATIATETDISPWLLHSRDPSLFVAGHPVEEHKPHTSETNATSWTLREGASGVSANSGTYLPMQRQALGFNVSAGASTSYGNGAAGNNVKDVSDFGGAGANTSNLEGAAGNRRKTETFVVYSPHDDKLETPVASFTTDDFACIQPHIGIAGCLVSIHEPAEATVWIENNWDNPLVASVQKNGCGGPFPWMLSPEKPALAIFGSYQDSIVVGMAQSLADVSGLPVAIRALEDNPALTLLAQDIDTPNLPVNSDAIRNENQTGRDASDDGLTPEGDHIPGGGESGNGGRRDDNLNGTQSNGHGMSVAERQEVKWVTQGAAGTSGSGDGDGDDGSGGPSEVDGQWNGPLHSTRVKLSLKPNPARAYAVAIGYTFKFAINRDTEIPINLNDLGPPISQPEVIAMLDFEIESVPRQTRVDRSYASIGFVAHREKSIARRKFFPRGFDSPQKIYKRSQQRQQQIGFQAALGVSQGPMGTATLSSSQTNGTTLEATDIKAMPTCCVKHEPGDEWNKDKKSYSSYNVAYQAHGTRWEADSLEDRPLEFRVGMGINLRPAGSEKPLPKISFVNRHQVLIWVSDPESKSRIRGIVVLMNSYLDNICTKDKLSILEEEEIELGAGFPPTVQPEEHQPGTISLSIAQVQKEEARSPNKLRAAVTTSLTRFGRRPSATQISLPDVPPYEYLARGWDATNNEWRSVLWPALDKYFRAADLEETPPVWRIQCPWKKARTTVGGNVTP